jgi:hypothetical protein
MGCTGSYGDTGQQEAEGALSSLSTPSGLDGCDVQGSNSAGQALNAFVSSSVLAVSSFSEVSSAAAAVSSSSMGTGRAQAEGALSCLSTPSGLDGCDVFGSNFALLALNASLGLRSTERSAAARCVTALATKSVAVGRNVRHIHRLHSCQNHPAGLWSTADANPVCCSEAVGRSWSVLANGASSPFASDRRSVLKEGRGVSPAPVLLFLTANRAGGSRSELCSVVYSGRVAMRAPVQPSTTGMDPGGRRPTVPRTLVEFDRSRRVSAGAQVLYTVLVEGERGCRMGTQASKLPRRSRSASRVVGGVLGAVARVAQTGQFGEGTQIRSRGINHVTPAMFGCTRHARAQAHQFE